MNPDIRRPFFPPFNCDEATIGRNRWVEYLLLRLADESHLVPPAIAPAKLCARVEALRVDQGAIQGDTGKQGVLLYRERRPGGFESLQREGKRP